MKTHQITLIAIAAFSAQVAGADDGTLTRAAVAAEVAAARASGELGAYSGEDSGSFWLSRQPAVSTTTRAEVEAQIAAARASGEMDAMHGEDSGSFHASQQPAAPAVPAIYAEAGE